MREDPYAAVAVNWRRAAERMSWLDSITEVSGHGGANSGEIVR